MDPLVVERLFVSYPGVHGLTSMLMGSRGSRVVVSGRIRRTGTPSTYANGRDLLEAFIANLEAAPLDEPADYHHSGSFYPQVVWQKMELVRDGTGKCFHYSANGSVFANFIMIGQTLI